MVKIYGLSLFLVTVLAFSSLTSARYLQLQGTDERDKRQIGDLQTAEYLALITLSQMHSLPSHCRDVACGLVNVIERISKRTMSDQRLAELQALIALSKGQGIPIGHGQIDPWTIGKRKKRSVGSLFGTLNTEQRMRVLNRLLSREEDSERLNQS